MGLASVELKKGYDGIALIYDGLARAVYGRTLIRVQRYLLHYVSANAHVLIVGGGTGWIIEELVKIHSLGLHITYVDSSEKMIAIARKRNVGGNSIEFIAAPVETLATERQYDLILTPFLLDNFTDEMLGETFPKMNALLKDNGLWLYCDFRNTDKWWQQQLLKIMYFFFRTTCGIKAKRLPDADGAFARYGYEIAERQDFMSGFIAAIVYKKNRG